MEEFALTVKFNNKPDCKPSDYIGLFDEWRAKYSVDIHNVYYEPDKQDVCHAHGLISLPRGFYRKKLSTIGVYYYIEKLHNRAGWLQYASKSQKISAIVVNKSPGEALI